MIRFMLGFLLLVGAAGLHFYRNAALEYNARKDIKGYLKRPEIPGVAVAAAGILGALLVALSGVLIVQPGEVMVPVRFGEVQATQQAGVSYRVDNFLLHHNYMDIKTQEQTFGGESAIRAKSSDGQSVTIDVTAQFHLDPQNAEDIFTTVGPNYLDKIVTPSVRSRVRDCTARHPAVAAFTTAREDIAQCSVSAIESDLGPRGVIIEDIKVRDVDPGQKVREAIERKLEAEQELERKEFELATAERNAAIRIQEARGIAESQQIINATLTDNYLMFEYIQALKELVDSPNNSTVILPFDSNLTPFIDVTGGGVQR